MSVDKLNLNSLGIKGPFTVKYDETKNDERIIAVAKDVADIAKGLSVSSGQVGGNVNFHTAEIPDNNIPGFKKTNPIV